MAFTNQDAQSLSDKLTAMELTDGEREALDAVFAAAGDDEVGGMSLNYEKVKYAPITKSLLGADIGIPQAKIDPMKR